MESYVVGFCFNEDKSEVALIKKTHPEWQKDKFNGIGGHIREEEDETPEYAMVREFKEEAGVETEESDWMLFAQLHEDMAFYLHCFVCYDDKIFKQITTCTDEVIQFFPTKCIKLRNPEFISNLSWLLGMCLDEDVERIDVDVNYQSHEMLTQER